MWKHYDNIFGLKTLFEHYDVIVAHHLPTGGSTYFSHLAGIHPVVRVNRFAGLMVSFTDGSSV